jgi:hypothetical protein
MTAPTDTRPLADAEQDELATTDAAYTRAFGRDMAAWDPLIRELYELALVEIYGRYPKAVTP